jgi:branched-chain amino acid aminotransferase
MTTPHHSCPQPQVAWHNGRLIPANQLVVSVDDIGFRQGATAVERLRTYNGQAIAIELHLIRWRRTLEELYLSIGVDLPTIKERISQLLDANQEWIDEFGDCGIVLLATPGLISSGQVETTPNEMAHLIPLAHDRIARHRLEGQPLFITNVEQPSSQCWPRDIKVRCRMHYYLADRQAHEHHPSAVGLLLDSDGTITETSVANLAIVRNGRVFSPPGDQVLPGVTQQLVEQACDAIGVGWQTERLWPAEVREADEVWLMGTDGGLWFANRVDGANVGDGKPGSVYRAVLSQFDRMVGN